MRTLARAIRPLVAVSISASLALAACSGGSDDESSGDPTTAASATAPPEPEFWPLTGIEGETGTVAQDHPVLVVKMDNTEASAPQLGLGKADMVVEELVEGGLTRLAAFFYSDLPETVGPVRSMRASDIGIVSPVGASVVTSGAAQVTIDRIKKAGITFYEEGADGFFRDSERSAPYNLFDHLTETAKLAKAEDSAVPDPYLAWATDDAFPAGQPASEIRVPFSQGHRTEWEYDGTHYVNINSNAADDDQFTPDTVLVLRTRIGDAGYPDPAGNPVPETRFTGTGPAMVFHSGSMVRATWTKVSESGELEISTSAGPLPIPAGHTWIELVPKDGDAVTFTGPAAGDAASGSATP